MYTYIHMPVHITYILFCLWRISLWHLGQIVQPGSVTAGQFWTRMMPWHVTAARAAASRMVEVRERMCMHACMHGWGVHWRGLRYGMGRITHMVVQ